MPQMYYYRSGVSDRDWIESRMVEIPEAKRQEVADEYERIYMSTRGRKNRKDANTYINQVALEYRQARYGEQQTKV